MSSAPVGLDAARFYSLWYSVTAKCKVLFKMRRDDHRCSKAQADIGIRPRREEARGPR